MWECNYAKEPLDLKLIFLRLIKHIWVLLAAALAGALIWGGGYYIGNVVLAGPQMYEKTSIYYVDYGTAPITGNAFTYINAYTWNEWVHTDEFADGVAERIRESGYELSGEEIKAYFSADLPSDLRMPYSTVSTPDPRLTGVLGEALEQEFMDFGQRQRDIVDIRVTDSGSVEKAANDDRTLRAVILGALLGFFGALTVLLFLLIADTSVHLPGTFTYRYGIPALGILYSRHGNQDENGRGKTGAESERAEAERRELAENLKYVFREKTKIALTSVEIEADLQKLAKQIPAEGFAYVGVPSVEGSPESATQLREAEGVLLLVRAGAHNGKQIESVLDFLKIQGIAVNGALLYDGDARLNRAYRMPRSAGGHNRKKAEERKDR